MIDRLYNLIGKNRLAMPLAVLAGLSGCNYLETTESVDDLKVDYSEYTFYNRMEVTKGDTTFTFIDAEGESSLNWDSNSPIGEDELERVFVRVGDEDSAYYSANINDDTLSGTITKAIFERFNPIYNRLRRAVKDSMRARYIKGSKGISIK